MVSGRGIRSSGQKRQRDIDDLGFPEEGDPSAFALAYLAVARERDVPARHPVYRRSLKDTDDIGLSSAGDPGDFACAFSSVRDPRFPARR
jgi:hypothetical protein